MVADPKGTEFNQAWARYAFENASGTYGRQRINHGNQRFIGGVAWRQRPLRLAFEYACIFREPVQAALDNAGIQWEMGVESESTRTVEASISADLAVHACLEGTTAPYVEVIRHGGELPRLPTVCVNMYVTTGPAAGIASALGQMIEDRYSMVRAA